MIAVDTHGFLRIVSGDGTEAARARELVATCDDQVGATSKLETGWGLSKVYGLRQAEVISALRELIGLPRVGVERLGEILMALKGAAAGMNPADALHRTLAGERRAVATLDVALERQARWRGRSAVAP